MRNKCNNYLLTISEQLQPIRIFISNEPQARLYKDVMFNLITLKYLSDSIDDQFSPPSISAPHPQDTILAVRPEIRPMPSVIQSLHRKNILWVPNESHWTCIFELIQRSVTSGRYPDTVTEFATTTISQIIDDALLRIEKENFLRQGIFNPISCYHIENTKLWEIVKLFNEVSFSSIPSSTDTKLDKKAALRFVYEECQNMLEKTEIEKRE